MNRWRNLLIIILCGFFAFGGTFTCKGSHGRGHHHDHDDDDDRRHRDFRD